ncbi:sulfatase [Verrucomicrobiota bacterium]
MNRRIFLETCMAGAAGAFLAPRCFAEESSKPNILFIFSDDHACQAIGAYGSIINKTPNIDRIAAEGTIFRNNFCCNSICAPSRATVLTGKHSHMNGQLTNRKRFNGKQMTFPKLLQKTGYQTAIFGKWHLGSNPTGFDEWMVFSSGQGAYYNPKYATPRGTWDGKGYSANITTNLALDWLNKREKNSNKPFLLMCQYKAPHRNWKAAPEYFTKYQNETIPEPPTLFDDYSGRTSSAGNHKMGIDKHMSMSYDLKVMDKPFGFTANDRKLWEETYGKENREFKKANLQGKDLVRWKYQRYIKDYLRCVSAVDDNVGRILDHLKETGLDKNTIVIYSSDQGFYLGEHGWFDKRWMYEESLRMPLVMRWPGKIKPGSEIKAMTQNIDFAPTFLEAAGVAVPEEMQGKSIIPLLKNPDTEWRKSIYYHYHENQGHGVPAHYGVRTERYKLIHFYKSKEWELFDLKKDPQELNSVYDQADYQEIRARLHKELDKLQRHYKIDASLLSSGKKEGERINEKT